MLDEYLNLEILSFLVISVRWQEHLSKMSEGRGLTHGTVRRECQTTAPRYLETQEKNKQTRLVDLSQDVALVVEWSPFVYVSASVSVCAYVCGNE